MTLTYQWTLALLALAMLLWGALWYRGRPDFIRRIDATGVMLIPLGAGLPLIILAVPLYNADPPWSYFGGAILALGCGIGCLASVAPLFRPRWLMPRWFVEQELEEERERQQWDREYRSWLARSGKSYRVARLESGACFIVLLLVIVLFAAGVVMTMSWSLDRLVEVLTSMGF